MNSTNLLHSSEDPFMEVLAKEIYAMSLDGWDIIRPALPEHGGNFIVVPEDGAVQIQVRHNQIWFRFVSRDTATQCTDPQLRDPNVHVTFITEGSDPNQI